jgi:hypothetical protein
MPAFGEIDDGQKKRPRSEKRTTGKTRPRSEKPTTDKKSPAFGETYDGQKT